MHAINAHAQSRISLLQLTSLHLYSPTSSQTRIEVRGVRATAAVRAVVLGLALSAALVLVSGPAFALTAGGDHTGEDHSFENHRNAYLDSITLDSANLTSTIFQNGTLTNAFFRSAVLDSADLRNADLTGSDFTNASLTGANAMNANFTNTKLDGAGFTTGNIRNAVFVGASLLGADLSSLSNANRADFTGATYDGTTVLAPGMDTSGMTFVPEPSSLVLLFLGLLGLELYSKRFASRAEPGRRSIQLGGAVHRCRRLPGTGLIPSPPCST